MREGRIVLSSIGEPFVCVCVLASIVTRGSMPPTLEPDRPRVSVIVPARDAEATLGETLASLRAQALADLEAIVVDDASADGTRALAEAAAARDRRFRLLALPANLGTAGARNAGLREARGRWVLFLDADDW